MRYWVPVGPAVEPAPVSVQVEEEPAPVSAAGEENPG
jgi:hypothetical protein